MAELQAEMLAQLDVAGPGRTIAEGVMERLGQAERDGAITRAQHKAVAEAVLARAKERKKAAIMLKLIQYVRRLGST